MMIERMIKWQIERMPYTQRYLQIMRRAYIGTDRQIQSQADREIDRYTNYRYTDRLIILELDDCISKQTD